MIVDDPDRTALALAGGLRDAGVDVGTDQVVVCARALRVLGERDPDRYWAGRLTLVRDPGDLAAYDAVFARVDVAASGTTDDPSGTSTVDRGVDRPGEGPADGEGPLTAGAVASTREHLRHRRFDHATDEELVAIGRALQRLEVAVPRRWSRRLVHGADGATLDVERTLQRALTTDGELVDLAWLSRRRRPRPLVLLLDVSGSMAAHARALLRFAVAARHTAVHEAGRRVEVFAFGTRLTRLTDALTAHDPDVALQAAADRVVDWDGGTRIGGAVDELSRRWARRGVLRGAVVVIASDGLERGDPDDLGRAMARLQRQSHRVVWVNPLAGDPRYEPRQRGMAAALPHVDRFLPGHDLASLEELADVLAGLR